MASVHFTPSVNGQSWDIDFLMAQTDALIASAEFLRASRELEDDERRYVGASKWQQTPASDDYKYEELTDVRIPSGHQRAPRLLHDYAGELEYTATNSALREGSTTGVNKHIRSEYSKSDSTRNNSSYLRAISVPSTSFPTTVNTTAVTSPERERASAGHNRPSAVLKDPAKADEFYRAGMFALEHGQAAQSLALFLQALATCPPTKRTAVSKIERQIGLAQSSLHSTTPRPATHESPPNRTPESLTTPSATPQPPASSHLSRPAAAHSTPPLPQPNPIHVGSDSDAPVSDTNPQAVPTGTQVSVPGRGGGDAQAADSAYRAGLAALERGEYLAGIEFLRQAASACPPERKSAAAKIQKLIREAEMLGKV